MRLTGKETLVLYTCYPFNYIGNAPERYVVTCDLVEGRDEMIRILKEATEVSAGTGNNVQLHRTCALVFHAHYAAESGFLHKQPGEEQLLHVPQGKR